MNGDRLPGALAVVLALAGPIACAAPKVEPVIASGASQATYAAGYPQALSSIVNDFTQAQAEVKKKLGELPGYPDKLKDPDWRTVHEVLERADEAGRSQGYVERMRRVEGAFEFFTTEKDEITRKVAGTAQFVAKKNNCEVELSGPTGAALKDAVDKALERELREANEGQLVIERHRAALGKENAAALALEADTLSRLSFLVRVQLVEDKIQIRRMLEEVDSVKSALDQAVKDEQAAQGDKRNGAAEKKAAEERLAELGKSKASLDAAVKQAGELGPKIEDQLKELEKQHGDAVRALLEKIDQKAAK